MGDLNIGTVYAGIDLDTQRINQRVDEVIESFKNISTGVGKASTNMSDAMLSGVTQYQNKLTVIEQKLTRQRQLMEDLERAASKPVIGVNSRTEVEKATQQLEKEKIKLKELENQFDSTYAAQRKFIINQDKMAVKAAEASKKLDNRKAGANFKAGIDVAVSGMRTFNQISPGLLGNISDIITQVQYAKLSMSSMGSGIAKWGLGISAAIGIATTLISSGIQKMKEAEEKRQRTFEEGIENLKSYSENLRTLEANIRIMNDEKSTVDEVRQARQTLASTFSELIMGYNEENEAILANNDTLKEYVKTQKQSAELARRETVVNYKGNDGLQKNKENLETIKKYLDMEDKAGNLAETRLRYARQAAGWSADSVQPLEEVIKDLEARCVELDKEILKQTQDSKQYYEANIKGMIELKNANGDVIGTWQDMNNEQEYATNLYLRRADMVEKLVTGEITEAQAAEELNGILNDTTRLEEFIAKSGAAVSASSQQVDIEKLLTEQYGEQKASIKDLTDAYKQLIDHEKLSEEQLHKLAITYPEIAEYIKETRDLSLDSGLKIADAMAGLDVSPQIDALNNLSSAYKQLSDGQSLSVSQLYTLMDQYPKVAEYINATGDASLQNGKILEIVYEARKQDLISALQSQQQEAQGQIDSTKIVIDSIRDKITALQELITMYGVTASAASELAGYEKMLDEQETALDKYEKKAAQIAASISLLEKSTGRIGNIGGTKPAVSKSSKSTRNEALQNELKQLEHKKKMDQLTAKEEIAWLERIRKKYKMNADEKMDLEYRIHSARKKLQEEAEKATSERLQQEYKLIENKKSLNQISAKEELAWLKKIQKTFKMNKEEQMELTIKLYHLEQQIRDDSIESLNTIGDAVTEALKNKYEEQRKLEEKLIDDSIKSWEEWEEKTVAAIQGEIDALDELAESQEKEEQRAEYERKRQALTLQLSYERDDYNRKQLQKELNRLDEEERKRQEALAREERKKELEAEIEAAQKKAEEQRDALEKEKDKIGETYDELLKDANLRAEAERAIMEQSQKQIVEMIKSYAPDYDLAGQSIGEKLVDGFMKKVGDIEKYFDSIQDKVTSYQQDMANVATKAADDFWKGRAEYEKKITAEAAKVQAESGGMTGVIADIRDYLSGEKKPQGFGQYSLEVNFNQPVESPVEMRRQLEKAMQELARKVGG